MTIESIAVQIAETIQKEANVNAVFGEPRKLDEHVVVPVARVAIYLGGGAGGPPGEEGSEPRMLGGGLGLTVDVRPVGFIRDSAEGARFEAVDAAPEGLIGKVEHLVESLRSGGAKE